MLKWEEILAKKNHIDVNWEIFITKFKELEKEFIPIKSTDQKRKGREKFPIDEKTRKKIKQKNALSKKLSKGNNNQEVRKEYNRVRNQSKNSSK